MLSFHPVKLHRSYEKVSLNPTGKVISLSWPVKSTLNTTRSNELVLLKTKEFKGDEVKKTWKNYVKFPGVLMVKKPTDEKY